MSRAFVIALALALGSLAACGPAIPRHAERARADLDALGLEAAREAAPDLAAAAEAAVADAQRAEDEALPDVAADHATRARLLGQAALAERERVEVERARHELEETLLSLEEEAIGLERAAEIEAEDVARLAAARRARDEMARVRAIAEDDEGRPRRRARVSLDEAAEIRRASEALRERARLIAAAAEAMGADTVAAARVGELISRSGGEGDPLESLSLADQAYDAARALLGQSRRGRSEPSDEERAALREAIASEGGGLGAIRMEEGPGIEIADVFGGSATRPSAAGQRRLERVAALLAAHPHGPISIAVDVPGSGASALRTMRARLDAVRAALVAAGIPIERIVIPEPEAAPASAEPGDRVRLTLPAY